VVSRKKVGTNVHECWRTRLNSAVICPCLIGRKHLMRRSYPVAVGDTTRQIFVVKKQKVQSGLMLDNSGRN
jgi:hypothetical protein